VFEGADLEKVKVEATVAGHERGKKIHVLKFKPKRGYKRRTGHRSELTRLEIGEIKQLTRKPAAASKGADAGAGATKAAPARKAPARKPAAKKEGAAAKKEGAAAKKEGAAAKKEGAAAKKPAAKKPAARKTTAKKPAARKTSASKKGDGGGS
jgi:large subunit ribosomal protein L21